MRRRFGNSQSYCVRRAVVLAYHHHLMMLVEKAEEIVAFCEATGDR